ncbi:MAG: transporter substrate-binding domain-containing protein [Myxococcota bacterium]|nr:transporter substrate-binding domain-containing protein [Myxococcota bacterium]
MLPFLCYILSAMSCRNGRLLCVLLLLGSACTERNRIAASSEKSLADAAAQPKSFFGSSTKQFVSTEDLVAIKERGVLRVLVHQVQEQFLQRSDVPIIEDYELAKKLGAYLGVDLEFVVVEEFAELLPKLTRGEGDIVAAQLTITKEREKQVAFTRPTLVVDEILVGKAGAVGLPSKLDELAGRTITVRESSSYADTLKKLAKARSLDVDIRLADEAKDVESLLEDVASGKADLTVVDSHLLAVIRAYNHKIKPLFPIATGREIAWAVRKNNKQLLAAANAVVMEAALSFSEKEAFVGDLEDIRKRGSLRVLMVNNPMSYFIYRGQQLGFDYEMTTFLAESLGVKLRVIVAPRYDLLIPWLLEGKGDVIASSLTQTKKRNEAVLFSKSYLEVDELIVQHEDAKAVQSLGELEGRTIHVRRSSSYFEGLKRLQEAGVKLEIKIVEESVDTEELIDRVGRKQIELTVADSNIVQLLRRMKVPVVGSLSLATGEGAEAKSNIAFAVRPSSEQLHSAIDDFVGKNQKGAMFNGMRRKYFGKRGRYKEAQKRRSENSQRISSYDNVIKRYASRYGFDWRLISAQAYAESRFNPKAKSWVGAVGLMQVMPRTGASLGFRDLENLDQGVHAGVKYMSRLVERFDKTIPFRTRVHFALAAYNAGLGHVFDARRLAKRRGLNPNRWFGHVEKAMLLLQQRKFAARARHGYCRGSESVRYVAAVQEYYDAYVKIVK